MKKISKKTIIMALSLILCLAVSVGLTTAYFTDYESAKGGAVLKLSGQTQLKEDLDGNNKTVVITNVGETDMIVRVQVIGENVSFTPGDDWNKVGDWWYYGKILKGSTDGTGDSTSNLVAAVSGPAGETNFDIVVVHEASRTVYEGGKLVTPNGWDEAGVEGIQ